MVDMTRRKALGVVATPALLAGTVGEATAQAQPAAQQRAKVQAVVLVDESNSLRPSDVDAERDAAETIATSATSSSERPSAGPRSAPAAASPSVRRSVSRRSRSSFNTANQPGQVVCTTNGPSLVSTTA